MAEILVAQFFILICILLSTLTNYYNISMIISGEGLYNNNNYYYNKQPLSKTTVCI